MASNTLLADLRKHALTCKSEHASYGAVDSCLAAHAKEVEKELREDTRTRGLWDCLDEFKTDTGFVLDLAQLALVSNFDVGDINEAGIFDGLCHGGNWSMTHLDSITLKNGNTILIKYGGSSPADRRAVKNGRLPEQQTKDISRYAQIQQIATTIGEDIPYLIWANPKTQRYAMTFLPGKSIRGRLYQDFQPHEVITSMLFETLSNIGDRHPGNVIEVVRRVLGHIDVGGEFKGSGSLPTSGPARNAYGAAKSHTPEEMEEAYPGWKKAMEDAYVRWKADWAPTLTALSVDSDPNIFRDIEDFFREHLKGELPRLEEELALRTLYNRRLYRIPHDAEKGEGADSAEDSTEDSAEDSAEDSLEMEQEAVAAALLGAKNALNQAQGDLVAGRYALAFEAAQRGQVELEFAGAQHKSHLAFQLDALIDALLPHWQEALDDPDLTPTQAIRIAQLCRARNTPTADACDAAAFKRGKELAQEPAGVRLSRQGNAGEIARLQQTCEIIQGEIDRFKSFADGLEARPEAFPSHLAKGWKDYLPSLEEERAAAEKRLREIGDGFDVFPCSSAGAALQNAITRVNAILGVQERRKGRRPGEGLPPVPSPSGNRAAQSQIAQLAQLIHNGRNILDSNDRRCGILHMDVVAATKKTLEKASAICELSPCTEEQRVALGDEERRAKPSRKLR